MNGLSQISAMRPIRLERACWLLALLLGAAVLSGCGQRFEPHQGPLVTESREVGNFDSVHLRGSAQLRISVGEPLELQVQGAEGALKRLDTEVSGNTLRIRTNGKDQMFSGGQGSLVITIKVPKLEALHVGGGNDVRIAGLDGGDVDIEIEGAANLKGMGRVDDLEVRLSGAGRADLRNLVAKDATVIVKGVGSVHVHSTGSLDARMNGVGAILYSGSPAEVHTSMRGLGTISRDSERSSDEQSDNGWDFDFDIDPKPSRDAEKDQHDESEQQAPNSSEPTFEV